MTIKYLNIIVAGVILSSFSCELPSNKHHFFNSIREVDNKIDSLKTILSDTSQEKTFLKETDKRLQHLLQEREYMYQFYCREYNSPDTAVFIINDRKHYWTHERVEELYYRLPDEKKKTPEGISIARYLGLPHR